MSYARGTMAEHATQGVHKYTHCPLGDCLTCRPEGCLWPRSCISRSIDVTLQDA